MTDGPISASWDDIEADTKFCCDAHRDFAKAMYFAGAMCALHELTGWEPDNNARPATVNKRRLAPLCRELTTAYHEPSDLELSAVRQH